MPPFLASRRITCVPVAAAPAPAVAGTPWLETSPAAANATIQAQATGAAPVLELTPPPQTFDHAYDRAVDYSWLCGQVQYSRLNKGWRLRYAPLDETDEYGGTVTLVNDRMLDSLRDGQYIRVRGRIVAPGQHGISPSYRVEAIDALEKSTSQVSRLENAPADGK